jgi:excisionase family DNA binding protein
VRARIVRARESRIGRHAVTLRRVRSGAATGSATCDVRAGRDRFKVGLHDLERRGNQRAWTGNGDDGLVSDRLLTADEVAEFLSVPVSWVRESTRSGAMPAIPLGRYWRYDRTDVLAWLESCKQPGRSIVLRRVASGR